MDFFLWGVLPYLTLLVLVGGLFWRYKYDQFGWTTRSTQLYESKLLRIASPLFHYSLFGVLVGHIVGLFIPKAWTDVVMTPETYHALAQIVGLAVGIGTLVGIAMLIYRRRTTGPVFMATTWNDKIMYLVLVAAIALGMWATVSGDHAPDGHHHDYRETVSIWFRSLLVFQPNVEAMAASTIQFKVHILVAFTLFAMIPFTRLVHAFTVPFHYLFRPYVVYRTRDRRPVASPTGTKRAGWEPVGTPDRQRDKARRQ